MIDDPIHMKITWALTRGRYGSHNQAAMAKYTPKGAWVISRNKRPCRTHRVDEAVIGWTRAGVVQVSARTVCGYVISNAATSADPLVEDYCDACLIALDGQFAVYRFFDADDRVLYIGFTSDLAARTQMHRNTSKWWHQVASSSVKFHDDELTARRVESAAIRAEQPPHNVAGKTVA